MKRRPRIGITTSRSGGGIMWAFCRTAVLLAGGAPVRITAGDDHVCRDLDGLLIGGGDDVAPTLYGGEIDPAIRIDAERDRLELRCISQADRSKLPVLGICRGAQILNVARGGSLHQEIAPFITDHHHRRTALPRKVIRITPHSQLHYLLGALHVRVNAIHHQAIDKLGDGLMIVARDRYGLVQAVERRAGRFIMGVQWHPEFLMFSAGQRRLFKALVRAARRRGHTE